MTPGILKKVTFGHQFTGSYPLTTFITNYKKHGTKFPSKSILYLRSLIIPGVLYNIPYMLARFMGGTTINSWVGSPIRVRGGTFGDPFSTLLWDFEYGFHSHDDMI